LLIPYRSHHSPIQEFTDSWYNSQRDLEKWCALALFGLHEHRLTLCVRDAGNATRTNAAGRRRRKLPSVCAVKMGASLASMTSRRPARWMPSSRKGASEGDHSTLALVATLPPAWDLAASRIPLDRPVPVRTTGIASTLMSKADSRTWAWTIDMPALTSGSANPASTLAAVVA
jgi:hypothetical protein